MSIHFQGLNFNLNPKPMKTPSELRDYFAAKALEGIFSNDSLYRSIIMDAGHDTRDKEKDTYMDYIAQQCYKMADAMMKERKIVLDILAK